MLNYVKRQIKRAFRPTNMLACDTYALGLLRAFEFDYQPWTAAAIRPSALCAILNEVVINQRSSVVEFGSGISTMYVGRLLQKTGGKLISFDHDADWHAIASRIAADNGLGETVELIHAPLDQCSDALQGCKWYRPSVIRDRLSSVRVDGVIVDGPPASSRGFGLARYPAVPVIRDFLSADSFFVYLDDIDRPGETEIFHRWEKELGVEGATEIIAGQYGMLRKGGRFATALCTID